MKPHHFPFLLLVSIFIASLWAIIVVMTVNRGLNRAETRRMLVGTGYVAPSNKFTNQFQWDANGPKGSVSAPNGSVFRSGGLTATSGNFAATRTNGIWLTNTTAVATGMQQYVPTNQKPGAPFTNSQVSSRPKSYAPGSYGYTKTSPMFVCWREWDGEIRIGGVAKSLATSISIGELGEYFTVEIQGPSGCANHEQLMFGPGTTNIVIGTNYVGTIQIGSNFYRVSGHSITEQEPQ